MASKTTIWDQYQGLRAESAMLVTPDGWPHMFEGLPIHSVCQAYVNKCYELNGVTSYLRHIIVHNEDTVFIAWRKDWAARQDWPALSWDAAVKSIAAKAPLLSLKAFEALVRRDHRSTAAKFDWYASAIAEFENPLKRKEKHE